MFEHREELREIKRLLYCLIDAIQVQRWYNNIEWKCKDFNFAQNVMYLAACEQDLYMFKIRGILSTILPHQRGLWAFVSRKIVFKRGEHWTDHYPFVLSIRGYEKECQEFYCLQKVFKDVNDWYLENELYAAYPICGYSNYLDVFYINIGV